MKKAEPITVAGVRRGIVMNLPDALLPEEPDLRARSDEVVAGRAWRSSRPVWRDRAARCAQRCAGASFGVEPLRFVPDLPGPEGGEARALTDDELDQLAMPPFDGIGHDAGWFDRVRRLCPAHAEMLRDLEREFRGAASAGVTRLIGGREHAVGFGEPAGQARAAC